jgi:uncharacterized membrane protein
MYTMKVCAFALHWGILFYSPKLRSYVMSSVKKACICSVCTALCYVLPIIFHALTVGAAFSPMHIPVLLCGLICGGAYGAFCGIAGPVISSLLSGMPATVQLIYMVPELCAYGLFAGIFYKVIFTHHFALDVYLSLVLAMIVGRIVGGAAQAIFYLSTARSYSVAIWAAGYLTGTLPGAVLQLIVIPALMGILTKTGLIPQRKSRDNKST